MKKLLAILLFLVATPALAQLSIEITGAGAQRIPIAIAPFPGEAALTPGITTIVRADLERSGLFRMVEVPSSANPPTEATNVNYAEWRARQADGLVLGSVATRADGRFEVRFKLFDTQKSADLSGVAYTLSREQARATAHRIADYVYEKFTGQKGVFATRIAFVVKKGNRFELQIADADGAGEETALASFEPIISPAWSPDGRRLAYIARNGGKFQVAALDLATRQVTVLTDSDKDESPSFAPNGRMILLATINGGRGVLSAVSVDGRIKQRVPYTGGDVREPAWGPFIR